MVALGVFVPVLLGGAVAMVVPTFGLLTAAITTTFLPAALLFGMSYGMFFRLGG